MYTSLYEHKSNGREEEAKGEGKRGDRDEVEVWKDLEPVVVPVVVASLGRWAMPSEQPQHNVHWNFKVGLRAHGQPVVDA